MQTLLQCWHPNYLKHRVPQEHIPSLPSATSTAAPYHLPSPFTPCTHFPPSPLFSPQLSASWESSGEPHATSSSGCRLSIPNPTLAYGAEGPTAVRGNLCQTVGLTPGLPKKQWGSLMGNLFIWQTHIKRLPAPHASPRCPLGAHSPLEPLPMWHTWVTTWLLAGMGGMQ